MSATMIRIEVSAIVVDGYDSDAARDRLQAAIAEVVQRHVEHRPEFMDDTGDVW